MMVSTQKLDGYFGYNEGKYAIIKIKNWEIYNIESNRYIKYPNHLVPAHMKVNNKVLISRSYYEVTKNIYTTKIERSFFYDEDGHIIVNVNDEMPTKIITPEHDKELLALGDAKIGDEFHLHTSKIVINEICDDFIIQHIHYLEGTIKELNDKYASIEVDFLDIQYPKNLLKKKGIKLKMDDYVELQGEELIKVLK